LLLNRLTTLAAVAVMTTLLAMPSLAQGKKRIDKAADLPRFTYRIDGKLEDVVRDEAKFKSFAAQLRTNIDSVLAQYDIGDKATERQLLGTLVQLDWLEGKYDDAMKGAAQIRALEDKPSDKITSGMLLRAMDGARRKSGSTTSPAYVEETGRVLAAELKTMPYPTVANTIKEVKQSAELVGENLVLGQIREVLQPTVDKAGALSSDFAPAIVSARYQLVTRLPLKQTLVSTYGAYLAANKVDKPDIWAARDVTLPPGRNYQPVNVAVWDSGVDIALFPGRVAMDGGKPAVIAFDIKSDPSTGELFPIPADLKSRIPQLKSTLKGLSDLQSNIDSPEATAVKQMLSTMKPDEYKKRVEDISLAGNYIHGTHVAGITMAGNPYARLVTARIEFDHRLIPDPCPSRELTEKGTKATQAYVDFMRKNNVRVANMSWGGSVKGYEQALELCNIGKTADERKAIAREYFDIELGAFKRAIASAPEILFVTSAGNSNSDSTFVEAYPAGVVAPNMISVGAVDRAGDEASFTSYGPTVVVHANGYQVESVIPGGEKLAESGTSMSSPQVANLAAKILAVNPKLKPAEVIAIIRDTADKTADGRRVLVNPAKAVATAEAKAGTA
jgi:cell division protein ZapA (FtsZ GTPase activity inhibitor)